jgi:peptidoglycan/xylan/chitin deacetylase (PgdA/CDA1 family)
VVLRLLAVVVVVLLAGCGGGTDRRARPPTVTTASATTPAPATTATTPAQPVAPAGPSDASPPARPRPQIAHRPPATQIEHGPRTGHDVALTFDADMTHEMIAQLRSGAQRTWYDAAIVRELRRTNTPATIFLTGLWTKEYPAVVRSLARDPLFELENHSVDHAAWTASCYGLPAVSGAQAKHAEVAGAAATIHHVAGVTPRYFRFPGGCHGSHDLHLVADAGERAVAWDVISGDPFQPDPAVVEHNVLSGVRPGSIVVMHLIGAPNAPATETALPVIIDTLKARGFRFVTLDELLGH